MLLMAYGNPGRRDDGLGPALVERLDRQPLPGLITDANYQPTVEDAYRIASGDAVIFVDATTSGPEPFSFGRCEPGPPRMGWSSHVLEPVDVLQLARELFGATPAAFVLAIRGYVFDGFGEELSPRARLNLDLAERFLRHAHRCGALGKWVQGAPFQDIIAWEPPPSPKTGG